jgi:hypothetical protein
MGMYTQLCYNAELRRDTPKGVIDTLEYMLSNTEEGFKPPFTHGLFHTSRWQFMLNCSSYYFAPAESKSSFRKDQFGNYYVSILCDLKNYDGEIEKFVDWLNPYVDSYEERQFLGYSRYEEAVEPTLIFTQEKPQPPMKTYSVTTETERVWKFKRLSNGTSRRTYPKRDAVYLQRRG